MRALLRLSWLSLCALGCQGPGAAAGVLEQPVVREAPASERGARVELSPEAQRIYRRTLVRDGSPPCSELTAGISDPVRALLEVSERASTPGASSIRAAACLLRDHSVEVEPHLLRWVHTRATMGLGLLVLNQLDQLEEGLAGRLVESALTGEIAGEARERSARSARYPALRARATEPAGATAPR